MTRIAAATDATLFDDGFLFASLLIPEVDLLARRVDPQDIPALAAGLNAAVHGGGDADGVREFILARIGGLNP